MQVKIITGCTSGDILFDDVSIMDKKLDADLDYFLRRLREEVLAGHIPIQDIVKLFQYDTCENIGDSCDQCGDTVEVTIWNI